MEGAYLRYDIFTNGGLGSIDDDESVGKGPVIVEAETNDNDDDGYPDLELACWTMRFESPEAALHATGKSRIGISGIRVTVRLNGVEVK